MQTTKLFILSVGVDPVAGNLTDEDANKVRQASLSEWTMEGNIAVAADNIHRALEHGLTYLPKTIDIPGHGAEELQWHVWGCQQQISKVIFSERDGGPTLVSSEGNSLH